MPSFHDFSLQATTLATLAQMNISEPTPIQTETIPALLAGRDLVGQSATGSGKTLAYSLPLVERLARDKRAVQALVLVPTRELALQVNAVLSKLAANRRLTTALLVGGKPYGKQIAALRYGAQIVVGTPGRVKDHIEQGTLNLQQTRICVLDEADQMLDIGFAPVIEDILTHTPETRQMALFSATMPDWIAKLEEKFLKDPLKVVITPATGEQSTIEQIAYQVPQSQKMAALCTLLQGAEGESTLIFGRTKYGVEKLGQHLSKLGFTVGTLHGNKSQHAREEVLAAFRRGQVQTLLATNVAARGLDIAGIYQVINYELPESSELFTHRIGRTGRMGRQGKAITLLVPADVSKWRRMARNLGQAVTLQKLAIDEAAATLPLRAVPVTQTIAEQAPIDEPGLAHSRQPLLFEQEVKPGERLRPVRSRKPARAEYDEPQPARTYRKNSFAQEQEPYREQWPARSRKPLPPVYEQYDEPQPVRARPSFSADRERGRFAQSRRSGVTPARSPQQSRSGRGPAHSTTWQEETFMLPERPRREGRKGAGKPSSIGKSTDRDKKRPFVTTETRARNQAVAAPAIRMRKNAATRRPAGR